jgi:hypothetical protein
LPGAFNGGSCAGLLRFLPPQAKLVANEHQLAVFPDELHHLLRMSVPLIRPQAKLSLPAKRGCSGFAYLQGFLMMPHYILTGDDNDVLAIHGQKRDPVDL